MAEIRAQVGTFHVQMRGFSYACQFRRTNGFWDAMVWRLGTDVQTQMGTVMTENRFGDPIPEHNPGPKDAERIVEAYGHIERKIAAAMAQEGE